MVSANVEVFLIIGRCGEWGIHHDYIHPANAVLFQLGRKGLRITNEHLGSNSGTHQECRPPLIVLIQEHRCPSIVGKHGNPTDTGRWLQHPICWANPRDPIGQVCQRRRSGELLALYLIF